MLKKGYRLKENRDFKRVYQRGKVAKNSSIVLYQFRSKRKQDSPNCRVGFSVSKKIGKAHVRNKIKRRLRHAVAPLLPQERSNLSGFLPGYDYIIIARQPILSCSFVKIEKELRRLLEEVKG